jgi:RNA 2',3'-cyclic 3'-phosphodiesterase
MRLFVGLAIPPLLTEQISRLIKMLSESTDFEWTTPDNLHITTKFIGEIAPSFLPDIIAKLTTIRATPFEVKLQNLGWAPTSHHPNSLFYSAAAITDSNALGDLANQTEVVLQAITIPKEHKSFQPHVTLARVPKSTNSLIEVRQRIATLTPISLATFLVSDFHLFESARVDQQRVYRLISTFRLGEIK